MDTGAYRHPHKDAIALFSLHSQKRWESNINAGQSLKTVADGKSPDTYLFQL